MSEQGACGCGSAACGCEAADLAPVVANPPGQASLHWRVARHDVSLERMRAWLADDRHPLALRALSSQSTDDPAIAILDAWAVVADVVAFYTERSAQEGFLRTATEPASVRWLARMLGYELRPGVAAQTKLAFDVETAAGAPASVIVPSGTPVQTIPAPGALPQVFETSAELEARGEWNRVPVLDRAAQTLPFGTSTIWLASPAAGVREQDRLLVVGAERAGVRAGEPHRDDHEKWDFRRVVRVEVEPEGLRGWTRLSLDRPIGYRRSRTLVAERGIRVFRLARRLNVFGWNATTVSRAVRGTSERLATLREARAERAAAARAVSRLELDGDQPEVVAGSWIVLEQPELTEAYRVVTATPGGRALGAASGKLTALVLDTDHNLDRVSAQQAIVHAVAEELPAGWMPRAPVGAGAQLTVRVAGSGLPAGRLVVVEGEDDAGASIAETATVAAAADPVDGMQQLTLSPSLRGSYRAATARVRGNVVAATHGETVAQVLGSGDGREEFPSFALHRPPLTYVRSAATASGARTALEVRVEDVAWREIASLYDAGPRDQVYTVRHEEDGEVAVVFGDGVHGSRLPTGSENVRALYRVGIGADGAAQPGDVSLLVRRPRGIAGVANPAATRDWAPPESLEEARTNAPQRVRTLDRAVSVADYEDFARGYAGVGRARAELVWDGRSSIVVLSVLDATGGPASRALLDDLRSALDDAREARASRVLLAGEVIEVGADVEVRIDPRHERDRVVAAVRADLLAAFGGMDLAAPLAASSVLVRVGEVAGVASATMPALMPGAAPGTEALLAPSGARWGGAALLAAQSLRLVDRLLRLEVIP